MQIKIDGRLYPIFNIIVPLVLILLNNYADNLRGELQALNNFNTNYIEASKEIIRTEGVSYILASVASLSADTTAKAEIQARSMAVSTHPTVHRAATTDAVLKYLKDDKYGKSAVDDHVKQIVSSRDKAMIDQSVKQLNDISDYARKAIWERLIDNSKKVDNTQTAMLWLSALSAIVNGVVGYYRRKST